MHLYFPFDEENDIELLAYNTEQLIFIQRNLERALTI